MTEPSRLDLSCAVQEGGGGGAGGPDHPLENYQNLGRSRTPEKSQSYQASIQCWAIIGPPAKRHLNGVSLGAIDDPLPSNSDTKSCYLASATLSRVFECSFLNYRGVQ